MKPVQLREDLRQRYLVENDHGASDYFGLIRELIRMKQIEPGVEQAIEGIYELIKDEIISNQGPPRNEINFGTSGWRGILGKDVYAGSVACVAQ